VEVAVDRVDTALNDHKAESHSDMATLTSHIADLRERVAKIEG
jgi:polyhydroxyalkanoate synthesis regulator phasin